MALWRDESSGGILAWPSWAFSNHDAPRVASRWGGTDAPIDRCKQFLALLVSRRGTIFMYQGEELGLPRSNIPFELIQDPVGKNGWPKNKGRDGCRTPMPWRTGAIKAGFSDGTSWLATEHSHLERAVDLQKANPESLLHFARLAIVMRRDPQQTEVLTREHKAAGLDATTLHLGTGFESDSEIDAMVASVLEDSAKHNYPLYIETHRATLTQDIKRTLDLIERFPSVRFNADLSHYYTGHEMTYAGEFQTRMAHLKPIFQRTRYAWPYF